MIWLGLYVLGILGFGGILFAVGRDDHSWSVLVAMAIGWFPLLLIAILMRLLGDTI